MAAVVILLSAGLLASATAWWRERRRRKLAEARHREDLTAQRRQREVELEEQARRTTALFDRMIEGLIVVDASGGIRFANRAAGAFFGFAAPAAGRTLLESVRHHEVAAVAARLDEDSEVLGHELRLEGAGPVRFLEINALALRDREGGRDGAILVFHDLTRLRELESVRQEFVANVSHELRTPLSLIKSAVETLLDGGKNHAPTLARFLEIIERHTNRLSLLIDDLLLLSTLDSGRLRLQLQAVSIRSAIQEVAEDFTARARARNISISVEVAPDLIAQADPDRLREVLSNLLDNAIKYGRAEGGTAMRARARPEGGVEISVSDDGPGIPAEAQARIFERFFRVDKARSREQGGTGLGLSIVKHVVQAHGGEVWVTSNPGAGSTFTFTLPATVGPSQPG
jgi:two-component system phosphate regulon sensor histidine kinase PhoR